VDVLIDRRELLIIARRKNLPLQIVEKDYVLGWLLYGFSFIEELCFKGGTALAKIYFPRIWRLSEDIDFSILSGSFESIKNRLENVFVRIKDSSGIGLRLKSEYSNPEYLQLKIGYTAFSKNWVKVDVMTEKLIREPVLLDLPKAYPDYPDVQIKVESLEEILAQKLRALVERKKCRDFFDVWLLLKEQRFNDKEVVELFELKCKMKGIAFQGIEQIFPEDILDILHGYWERELSRLIHPVPPMESVITQIKERVERTLGKQ
jgi:predicted nucleotidyltransferase component of viral defense system